MHIHTRDCHYGSYFQGIEKSKPELPHFFLRNFQSNTAYVYNTIASLVVYQWPPCSLKPISNRRFSSRLEVLSPRYHTFSLTSTSTFSVHSRREKILLERLFPRREEDGWQNQMKMVVGNKEATVYAGVPRLHKAR